MNSEGYKGYLLERFVGKCLSKMLMRGGNNPDLKITRDQGDKKAPAAEVYDFFIENNKYRSADPFFKEEEFYVEVKTRLTAAYLNKLGPMSRTLYIIFPDNTSKYEGKVPQKIVLLGLDFLKKLALEYPEVAVAFHIGDEFPPLASSVLKGLDNERRRKLLLYLIKDHCPDVNDSRLMSEVISASSPSHVSPSLLYEPLRGEKWADYVQALRRYAVQQTRDAKKRNGTANRAIKNTEDAPQISLSISDETKRCFDDLPANFFSDVIKNGSNVIMILGNGVSLDFGSPSWDRLAGSLSDYLVPKYSDDLESLLKIIGDSKLAETQLARTIVNQAKFYDVIYSQIYGKFEEDMLDCDTLLSAVGDVVKEKDVTLATYNYDEFLEMYLRKKRKLECVSVYDKDSEAKADTNKKKIFHLHGFIDYDKKRLEKLKAEKDVEGKTGIVLTMRDYMANYKDGEWCAEKQKSWLNDRENKILYVGSSMTDAYQLSLIANTGIEEEGHVYALLALNGLSEKNKLSLKSYYDHIHVTPVFASDFKTLPCKLRELFGLKC